MLCSVLALHRACLSEWSTGPAAGLCASYDLSPTCGSSTLQLAIPAAHLAEDRVRAVAEYSRVYPNGSRFQRSGSGSRSGLALPQVYSSSAEVTATYAAGAGVANADVLLYVSAASCTAGRPQGMPFRMGMGHLPHRMPCRSG